MKISARNEFEMFVGLRFHVSSSVLKLRVEKGGGCGMSKRARASPGPADQPGALSAPPAKKQRDGPGTVLCDAGRPGSEHGLGAKTEDKSSKAQGRAGNADQSFGASLTSGYPPAPAKQTVEAANASGGASTGVGTGGAERAVQRLDHHFFLEHVHLTWQRLRKERMELNKVCVRERTNGHDAYATGKLFSVAAL